MVQVMVFGLTSSGPCSLLFSMALSLEEPPYWLSWTYWRTASSALEIMGKVYTQAKGEGRGEKAMWQLQSLDGRQTRNYFYVGTLSFGQRKTTEKAFIERAYYISYYII